MVLPYTVFVLLANNRRLSHPIRLIRFESSTSSSQSMLYKAVVETGMRSYTWLWYSDSVSRSLRSDSSLSSSSITVSIRTRYSYTYNCFFSKEFNLELLSKNFIIRFVSIFPSQAPFFYDVENTDTVSFICILYWYLRPPICHGLWENQYLFRWIKWLGNIVSISSITKKSFENKILCEHLIYT